MLKKFELESNFSFPQKCYSLMFWNVHSKEKNAHHLYLKKLINWRNFFPPLSVPLILEGLHWMLCKISWWHTWAMETSSISSDYFVTFGLMNAKMLTWEKITYRQTIKREKQVCHSTKFLVNNYGLEYWSLGKYTSWMNSYKYTLRRAKFYSKAIQEVI